MLRSIETTPKIRTKKSADMNGFAHGNLKFLSGPLTMELQRMRGILERAKIERRFLKTESCMIVDNDSPRRFERRENFQAGCAGELSRSLDSSLRRASASPARDACSIAGRFCS
jgi:hypothetical protein